MVGLSPIKLFINSSVAFVTRDNNLYNMGQDFFLSPRLYNWRPLQCHSPQTRSTSTFSSKFVQKKDIPMNVTQKETRNLPMSLQKCYFRFVHVIFNEVTSKTNINLCSLTAKTSYFIMMIIFELIAGLRNTMNQQVSSYSPLSSMCVVILCSKKN